MYPDTVNDRLCFTEEGEEGVDGRPFAEGVATTVSFATCAGSTVPLSSTDQKARRYEPGPATWTVEWTPPSKTRYTYVVTASDLAGNRQASAKAGVITAR